MTGSGTRCRGRVVAALGLVFAGLYGPAMRSAAPETYTLHIASQPLESALQEFARQTGVEILVFSYLTDGQRAPALEGRYTVDGALRALLTDSMLTFRHVNTKTIEI